MKTIYKVYESLLDDIENTMSRGMSAAQDEIVAQMNKEASQLRKAFGVVHIPGDVFSLIDGPEKTLVVDPSSYTGSSCIANIGNGKVSELIGDVDCIECRKRLIVNGGNQSIDISDFAPKIVSDCIEWRGIKSIDGISMFTRDFGNRIIQKIEFDDMLKSLSNCELSINVLSGSRIWFHSVPELKNVVSKNIKDISIVYSQPPFKTIKPWSEKAYNNLFDFGYDLNYTVGLDGKTETVNVKNIAALKKLVTAKDFYSRIYTEWPVKLKPGAKMANFIDVTGFEKLDWLTIHDGKMGIVCENTKNSNRIHRAYFTEMLKNCYFSKATEHIAYDHDNIIDNIPVTADGWRIAVVRL